MSSNIPMKYWSAKLQSFSARNQKSGNLNNIQREISSFSRLASGEAASEGDGGNDNADDDGGRLALPYPSRSAHTTVVQAAGVRPARPAPVPGECDRYPGMLHELAFQGKADEVETLLRIRPSVDGSEFIAVTVDALNDNGETALICAAARGHAGVCQILANLGADLSFRKINTGKTALHYAAEEGHTEAVELLVKSGADINAPAKIKGDGGIFRGDHRTPLHLACARSHEHVIALLVKGIEVKKRTVRASWDVADGSGLTPLHLCAARNLVDSVRLLLDMGCPVDVGDSMNQTPLHHAVLDLGADVVEELLLRGADPMRLTDHGMNAMRMVCGVISKHKKAELEQKDKDKDTNKDWFQPKQAYSPRMGFAAMCLQLFLERGGCLMPTDRYYKLGITDRAVKVNADNIEKHANLKAGKGFIANRTVVFQRRINRTRGIGDYTDEEARALGLPV